MPLSRLSVGRDCTIDLTDPNTGGIVSLAVVTSFDAKMDGTQLKSKALDGVVRHATEYDGWSGSINLDRKNPNLDAFFAVLEGLYYSGQNVAPQTITQTVQESDGSISQYRYTGVALDYQDAGNWQNGKFVAQKLSWRASRRIKVI